VVGVANAWYPVYGHPFGPDRLPEFVALDDLVYPVEHGPFSAGPWFTIDRELVYPTVHHPIGVPDQPWYEILGSMIYAVKAHPDGPQAAPWYQVRPTTP
jgi:hypothetical protein